MLLLVLTRDRVFVTEDEVHLEKASLEHYSHQQANSNLGSRASQIRTEHDHPWRLVVELLATRLETIFQELHVTTAAVAALLVLDLVLDDERLFREVDGLGERRRDSMVSGLALGYETLVALDDDGRGFLDLPFADITERLGANGSLLGGLGNGPPV